MILKNEIHKGHVLSYNKLRQFGFVESEDSQSHFFYIDKKAQSKIKIDKDRIHLVHRYHSGDEVEFKIRKSELREGQTEAYDLKFIRNVNREKLVKEYLAKGVLTGQLKVSENILLIHHDNSNVNIYIYYSIWEKELNFLNKDLIDSKVNFTLMNIEEPDKIIAILYDRKFTDEYLELKKLLDTGKTIEAIITGKYESGFIVSILENRYKGNVHHIHKSKKEVINGAKKYIKGEIVQVKLLRIEESIIIQLRLVETIDDGQMTMCNFIQNTV